MARKVPRKLRAHGKTLLDNYYWMRDRSNPRVLRYVKAENEYTRQMMEHTAEIQKNLFKELKGRVAEADISVPEKVDGFYYYSKMAKGKQYLILCRRKGSLRAREEVILDENQIAKSKPYLKVNLHKISPDHNHLMYLADTSGAERNTLRIKDLRTGKLLKDRIENTSTAEWASDGKTIFYTILDREWRAHKVMRHVLGTDPRKDALVHEEKDASFNYMELSKTKSRKFILITLESATTSEVRYINADEPLGDFKIIRPRKHGESYYASHYGNRFFIVTNIDAINFRVMEAPESDPSERNWKELIPHRESVCIDVGDTVAWVEPFRNHLVVFERENAQGRAMVYDLGDMSAHPIDFPETQYFVRPVLNPDPDSEVVRLEYWSFVTPTRVYDYDLRTGRLSLRKEQKVNEYRASDYRQELLWAAAKDGAKIPLSVVYRKGLGKNSRNPAYLYGYGAYATFEWSYTGFNPNLVSLLDRGFVYAYAHIRGGGDMGRAWYHDGRMLKKMNTFTDFIACAEHLISSGYTSPERLVVRGRSAGGLLMGAISNMRPDLFKAIIAEVPFVDVISTMIDPSIPLTTGEFEEWGNPRKKGFYNYMVKYSPYDNVAHKDYPSMLVTGSLHDSRVQYWEPLKWVAKLREMKTDHNPLLLRISNLESHAGASGRYDYLKYVAFMYAFMLDQLGITK